MSDDNQPTNTEETPAVSESEEVTTTTNNETETTDDAPKNEDDADKEEESTATFEPVVCYRYINILIYIYILYCAISFSFVKSFRVVIIDII